MNQYHQTTKSFNELKINLQNWDSLRHVGPEMPGLSSPEASWRWLQIEGWTDFSWLGISHPLRHPTHTNHHKSIRIPVGIEGKNMEKQRIWPRETLGIPKILAMSIHGEPPDSPEAPEAPDTSLNRLSWAMYWFTANWVLWRTGDPKASGRLMRKSWNQMEVSSWDNRTKWWLFFSKVVGLPTGSWK